eukprot:SAG31_NODE_32887_length_350_cov_1.223108_1_plen_23_part_01
MVRLYQSRIVYRYYSRYIKYQIH